MACRILKCTSPDCINQFQDSKYGEGKRVMNSTLKGTGKLTYRCTVCSKERSE